jgi:peroxiredoxin
MKNFRIKRKLCCLVTTAFLFVAGGIGLYATNAGVSGQDASFVTDDPPQSVQESMGGRFAPQFTLTAVDGKRVNLADYSGKYVVLNFWASSSPESRKVCAEMAKLEKKYPKTEIAFIGISLDENQENWRSAVQQDGLTYTQVSELKNLENADIAKQYDVRFIPLVYIISPDKCIFDIRESGAEIEEILDRLFNVK